MGRQTIARRTSPKDTWEPFRYEVLNRSAVVQRAVANRSVLDASSSLCW